MTYSPVPILESRGVRLLVDYLNARGYTGEFWLSADKQAERMAANRKRAAKK
jgi:hypothetical protein